MTVSRTPAIRSRTHRESPIPFPAEDFGKILREKDEARGYDQANRVDCAHCGRTGEMAPLTMGPPLIAMSPENQGFPVAG